MISSKKFLQTLKTFLIVGVNWGDEGKAKVVNVLLALFRQAKNVVVIRFQGGHNAGHTIEIGDQVYVLHSVPSGIVFPNTLNLIGKGCVLNPDAFFDEIDSLEARGIDFFGRLFIDSGVQLITPLDIAVDEWREKSKGKNAVGTTGRGIGPAYGDKIARCNLKVGNLRLEKDVTDDYRKELQKYYSEKVGLLKFYRAPVAKMETFEEFLNWCSVNAFFLENYIADTCCIIQEERDIGTVIIEEGAQGVMLDIDHGSFPGVTSSSIDTYASLGHTIIPDEKIGILKAYTTRVGNGVFPTELFDSDGDFLQKNGKEVGASTGRKRRCGWLDLFLTKYTCRISGVTGIFLTKLDILSGISEIKICTGYKKSGLFVKKYATLNTEIMEDSEPVYKTFIGFEEDISGCRSFKSLPLNARKIVNFIARNLKIPIYAISVGPEESQVIWMSKA